MPVGRLDPLTTFATPSFSVTTTPLDGGTAFLCIGATMPNDPGPTEGRNALIAGSNTGDRWFLTFSLRSGKRAYAVGFYLTDAAEVGDAVFTTDNGQQVIAVQCCKDMSIDGPQFFGFVSETPFKSFQLTNTGAYDGWGIDEVMLGYRKPRR